MAESHIEESAAAAPAITLSAEQFDAIMARTAPAPVEAAPVAAEVTESVDDKIARMVAEGVATALAEANKASEETEDERVARLVKEGIDAETATLREAYEAEGAKRKGLVADPTEGDTKSLSQGELYKLHESDPEAYYKYTYETLGSQPGMAGILAKADSFAQQMRTA